jgi:ResB-like family
VDWRQSATRIIGLLGGARLALLLIGLLTILCLAGALLPQEVRTDPDQLARWQGDHSVIMAIAGPLELFSAFRSPVFLTTCLLLAINTLCCSGLRVKRLLASGAFKGLAGLRAWGFTIMHLGIIGILSAGCMSVWLGMDGVLIATEGYPVTEEHDNFRVLREGSLRPERHSGLVFQLEEVIERYVDDNLVHRSARVGVGPPGAIKESVIEVNHPLSQDGIYFTFDRAGYIPRVRVYDLALRRELLRADVILSMTGDGLDARHLDILPLDLPPARKHRMAVSLFPISKDGKDISVLVVMLEDLEGNQLGQVDLAIGEKGKIGSYFIEFLETRRWTSFRVMADPGYPVAVFFLWLSLAGLVLRYLPDFLIWPVNVKKKG